MVLPIFTAGKSARCVQVYTVLSHTFSSFAASGTVRIASGMG